MSGGHTCKQVLPRPHARGAFCVASHLSRGMYFRSIMLPQTHACKEEEESFARSEL